MFDCANVEMRELLPELAAGALDTPTLARVEAHVAGCAECASELETLRLVRSAFIATPGVDAPRIVAALPKPGRVGSPPAAGAETSRRTARSWADWRIAAALTVVTLGGLSAVVTQRLRAPGRDTSALEAPRVPDTGSARRITSPPLAPVLVVVDSPPATTAVPNGAQRPNKVQLAFDGAAGDADRATLEALMGALDEIDRAPVAPSAEPDRAPMLPVITEGGR